MSGNSDSPPETALWASPQRVQDIGAFVSTVRGQAGLTQAQLAERAGVGRRFVNELETGHTTLFVERLAAVLRELGVEVVLEAGPRDRATAHGIGGRSASRLETRANTDVVSSLKDLGW